MRRAAILLLFALPAFAAEPSKFTLAQSGGAADPLTVLGPASVCADQKIALWNGASNTSLQCSALTVADTTGTLTGPAGGFSIIGGTGASDLLTLDGSAGTAGTIRVSADGFLYATGGLLVDPVFGGGSSVALYSTASDNGTITLGATAKLGSTSGSSVGFRNGATPQTVQVYGTSDGTWDTFTNYARLSLAATDGTMTIAAETAGTAADDQSIAITPAGVGTVKITAAQLVKSATPPVTCAAGTEGALYLDSDTHKLCYCNATGWVLASDDTTGCS